MKYDTLGDEIAQVIAFATKHGTRYPVDAQDPNFLEVVDFLSDGKPGPVTIVCCIGLKYGWVGLQALVRQQLVGSALYDAVKDAGGTAPYFLNLLIADPLSAGAIAAEHEFRCKQVEPDLVVSAARKLREASK